MQTKKNGIGEEYKEEGFYPVIIENPPENFESFDGWDLYGYDDGECYGYVVDLKNINEKENKRGEDYKKYETFNKETKITFGKNGKNNDVYIYDATGKMYYAKGYYAEGGVYYSDVLTKDGPIISIEREYDETNNVVNMSITVTPEKDATNLKLTIDGTEIAKAIDGTYKYTATQNGTYVIKAEESSDLVSVKKAIVTQIKSATYIITYHFPGVSANQTQVKTDSVEIRLIVPTKVEKEGYILEGFSKDPSASTLDYKVGQIFTENQDIDLYAYWKEGTPETYQITFNANGGKNAPASIRKTQGESVTLPLSEVPIRDGYVFKGWSTKKEDINELYAPGSEYAEDGNTVLYAIWEEGETRVDIKIVPSNAGKVIKTGSIIKGNTIYVTATANVGYVFDRWTIAEDSVSINLADMYSEKTKFTMKTGVVSLIANFKETNYDYTIKYNANKGTSAPEAQSKKHDVDIVLSTQEPIRTNYAFVGWTDSLSSNVAKYMPGSTYSENKSVTLYAIWAGDCIVTFDANTGIVSTNEKTVKIGEAYGDLPTPTKTGYTFDGWYTQKELGDKIESTSIVPKIATQTLYAHWSPNNYMVEYNGNGNTSGTTASSNHVYDLEKALTSNGFKKAGYTFKNWNTKSDGTGTSYEDSQTVSNLTTTPNGIVTLYAQWTAHTYEIKYDGNGSTSGTMPNSTHVYGIEKSLTKNGYTKDGYKFKNWNTASDGTGKTYANSEKVINLTEENGGVITLYAQWGVGTYKINYDGNGSTSGITSESEHTYDEEKALTKNGYERTGYSFKEWNTERDGTGTAYANEEKVKNLATEDNQTVTLYAQWQGNTYTINYDGNGQTSGTMTSSIHTYGIEKALNANAYTKQGYNFIGWNTKSDGTGTSYSNEEKVKNLTTINNGTVTLYAKWEPKTYTVTFNANGGEIYDLGAATTTKKVTYGQTFGTLPTAERTDYSFTSWNTKSDGTGTTITSSTVVDETASGLTLYAQWVKKTVYAVYSSSDKSLRFYNTEDTITANKTYNNLTATRVYTGFENLNYTDYTKIPWYSYIGTITKVVVEDKFTPTSMSLWFCGFTKVTTMDLSKLDTSEVTSLYGTFYNCSSLQSINVSTFDTSSATNMSGTFRKCASLTTIDVSKWVTTSVTDMSGLFYEASKLTTITGLNKWDTSKVTTMNSMFASCTKLSSVDLNNWETGNVTDMYGLFWECKSLSSINVSNWDTSNVTKMSGLFNFCAITTVDVSKWNTSKVKEFNSTFAYCTKLTNIDVSGWDTSKVTDMYGMFYECSALQSLNLSSWDTSSVTNMRGMFEHCSVLTTVGASSWNTSKVTNMNSMFAYCTKLSLNCSSWTVTKVTDGQYFKYGASSVTAPSSFRRKGWALVAGTLVFA